MKKTLRFIFDYIEEILCCTALTVTIIAVLINIVSGTVLGKRFGQCEEIAKSAFVWITFVGVSLAYKRGNHICIDFVVKSLPPKGQRAAKYMVWAVLFGFDLVILYYAVQLTVNTSRKTLPLCGISYAYINVSLIIGFGLMLLRLLTDVVKELRAVKTR